MQLFYQPAIKHGVHHLDAEESRHCIKVLRKKQHDQIDIVDGKGTFYQAIITDTNPKETHFQIVGEKIETPKAYRIHLAVAPTKRMERMEWMVEKATELGVDQIAFLECHNSERNKLRLDRLQRKAISAMKQSIKATLPTIEAIVPIEEFFMIDAPDAHKLIANLSENAIPLSQAVTPEDSYQILIGPEGDFTPHELTTAGANGFQTVHLGPNRLRTETAAIAASTVVCATNWK